MPAAAAAPGLQASETSARIWLYVVLSEPWRQLPLIEQGKAGGPGHNDKEVLFLDTRRPRAGEEVTVSPSGAAACLLQYTTFLGHPLQTLFFLQYRLLLHKPKAQDLPVRFWVMPACHLAGRNLFGNPMVSAVCWSCALRLLSLHGPAKGIAWAPRGFLNRPGGVHDLHYHYYY